MTPSEKPPSEKQIRYARVLGIEDPETLSREEVSTIIGHLEWAKPSLREERERYNLDQKIRKHGQAKVDEETYWESLADANKWMLVVYRRGKSRHAKVVEINGAHISARGSIRIESQVLKLTDFRYGPFIGEGAFVEIASEKIERYVIVDEIEIDNIAEFQRRQELVESWL